MPPIQERRGEKIHSRRIAIESWAASDGIVVEGRLHDERLAETYAMSGARRPPGTIHDMILRLHVTGPPLVVADAEAELPGVPYEDCRETVESARAVVGMPIRSGFTEAAKRRLGGPRGCAHLTALLLAMAPAAVQGFWTLRAVRPLRVDAAAAAALEHYLIDTCRVWRRDGPRARSLLAAAAGRKNADDREPRGE